MPSPEWSAWSPFGGVVPPPVAEARPGGLVPCCFEPPSANTWICEAMPPLDDALRVPATKVEGCASQVWIAPRIDGTGRSAVFDFAGDSDAMIVRGLIAVLHALYSGLLPEEILAVDAPAALGRLGLDAHLSAQRSNGLRAMVARIRAIAETTLNNA